MMDAVRYDRCASGGIEMNGEEVAALTAALAAITPAVEDAPAQPASRWKREARIEAVGMDDVR